MKKILLVFGLLATGAQLWAQASSPITEGNDAYHILDRIDIMSGGASVQPHTALRPRWRADAAEVAEGASQAFTALDKADSLDMAYLKRDNAEYIAEPELSKKSWFKTFYKQPANFYALNIKHFRLSIDPALQAKVGYETHGEGGVIFSNRRGLQVRGLIDERVSFNLDITENQEKFASYMMDRIAFFKAVPGGDYFKIYNSRLTNGTAFDGYDYLTAQGQIGVKVSKHFGLQFGHGRNFIGEGYRSLLLSDVGANYFYLKLNTRIWRFHYQNIFAELNAKYDGVTQPDQLLPKKYMAAHYLDFSILPNMSIGLFETVVFSRKKYFEFQYLNPLILYRTVEHGLGSPDNVILGLNGKWNFLKHVSLYGQFILDEFNFSQLRQNNGWWGNKYGVQVGAKYINAFGVNHLDLQAEMNIVRPYTYTHDTLDANYTHYNQPLAHPLGANFMEAIGILRYQPIQRLAIFAKMTYANTGLAQAEAEGVSNYGSNIFLPNRQVAQYHEYQNSLAQGVNAKLLTAQLRVSYQIKHNLYVDLEYFRRSLNASLDQYDHRTSLLSLGLRLNMGERNFDY